MTRPPGPGSVTSAREPDLVLARNGDQDAFTRLVRPLRPELHAHCYRLLGSTHDADDAIQEAMLRAWRGLSRFEERASLRSWLYTVTTRACLDQLAGRRRRALPVDLGPANTNATPGSSGAEVAWLEPYPHGVPEGVASGPEARYDQREAVELAFVAALQHLPGNQRAALLLVEVLGYSAAEVASMMGTSTASVNSALQRARLAVSTRVPPVSQSRTLRALGDGGVREIVTSYAEALERGDARALVALLTEDVTWSMPPLEDWYAGRDAVMGFAVRVPLSSCGSWRYRRTTANGQPAVAFYLREEEAVVHRAWSVTVLSLRGDRIAGLTSFLGAEHFPPFGLPPVWEPQTEEATT
ncbi:sigma-70 family RNA polymerase sigma factor [Actinoalloteichus caeruleus]|uniref:sigma-70 family RNA polymerase sigma factor n=1 Tax=Actinoalloteichus cyanogriseus TaxID=2893586 RepID=UPI00068B5BE8|nr:sigma-70 family RNA polymerase sigma factor [Actinoalloteichus caeruleus]